jgi:hypothetical protein
MRRLSLLVTLVAASTFATACGYEHTSSRGLAPSSTGTAPAANNAPATSPLVGMWVSAQAITIPSAASCGNFQWEITSQTATSITEISRLSAPAISASPEPLPVNSTARRFRSRQVARRAFREFRRAVSR